MTVYTREEVETYFNKLDRLWQIKVSWKHFVKLRNELKVQYPKIGMSPIYREIKTERIQQLMAEERKSG